MELKYYIEDSTIDFNNWNITDVSKWFNDALKDSWEIIKGSYEEGQVHLKKDSIKAVVYFSSSTSYYKNRCGVYILNEFDFATKLNNKKYNYEYIKTILEEE